MSNRLTQAANIQVTGVPSGMGGKGRKINEKLMIECFPSWKKIKIHLKHTKTKKLPGI